MTIFGQEDYVDGGRQTSTNYEKAETNLVRAITNGAPEIEILRLLGEARILACGMEKVRIEEVYSREMGEQKKSPTATPA